MRTKQIGNERAPLVAFGWARERIERMKWRSNQGLPAAQGIFHR